MELKMPVAKRERLEELLEYLGDTGNYSEYYDGNRAEDFKKCFDVESEWCWKYADIVLRGLEKRPAKPGDEAHHAVPKSFYGVRRNCNKIDAGNLFTLSYAEHMWVHYCACYCATGEMRGKMARAFMTMYRKGICKKHALMPSETELLDAIPEMEIKRIQAMEPQWAKVEAEGRTHYSEDPKQYKKDYAEANKEKILEREKARYATNREQILEQKKAYREANKEKILEREKARYEANKEKLLERNKAYREANKEKLLERKKARYEANKEKIAERKKAYREANKDKLSEYNKVYYATNKEKILERDKVYYATNKEKILEKSKAYSEANKEKLAEYGKAYREANREQILEQKKAYHEANREQILEQKKAYREANREKVLEIEKAYRDAKKAAGYRYRKDPVTGKKHWVFVGLPEAKEVA